MAPRLNVTRARQGRSGKPVLWVLGISTTLAAVALFGAWAMKSGDLTQAHNSQTPEAARSMDMPDPTPRQNTDSPPPVS